MISTDFKDSGAGVVTPPAVGLCPVDQLTLMSGYAAAWTRTGRSVTGPVPSVRLRGSLAAAGTTGTPGALLGATARPSVQTTALRGAAVIGVPFEHTSSTPGDLPPEDPLSR